MLKSVATPLKGGGFYRKWLVSVLAFFSVAGRDLAHNWILELMTRIIW